MSILQIGYPAAWGVLGAVVLAGLWRLAAGPSLLDRLVGFDTAVIAIIGWIVMFSIRERTGEYLELIIVVTALGFLTTVSYFYYLSQPDRQLGQNFHRGDEHE